MAQVPQCSHFITHSHIELCRHLVSMRFSSTFAVPVYREQPHSEDVSDSWTIGMTSADWSCTSSKSMRSAMTPLIRSPESFA